MEYDSETFEKFRVELMRIEEEFVAREAKFRSELLYARTLLFLYCLATALIFIGLVTQ